MVYGLIYLVYRWSDLTTSLDINLYQYHNNWGGWVCLFLYQNAGWYLIPGVGVSILISKCRLVFDTRGGCVYFYIECRLVFDTNLGGGGSQVPISQKCTKMGYGFVS